VTGSCSGGHRQTAAGSAADPGRVQVPHGRTGHRAPRLVSIAGRPARTGGRRRPHARPCSGPPQCPRRTVPSRVRTHWPTAAGWPDSAAAGVRCRSRPPDTAAAGGRPQTPRTPPGCGAVPPQRSGRTVAQLRRGRPQEPGSATLAGVPAAAVSPATVASGDQVGAAADGAATATRTSRARWRQGCNRRNVWPVLVIGTWSS
jgi:hypothetical protein